VAGKNYFKILDLPENTSKKEVKRRFKELAKIYHPDINKNENANEEFLKIKEAYEKIINPTASKIVKSPKSKTKSQYDKYSEQAERLYQERKKRKEKEIREFYTHLRSGWRRNLIWANVIIGVIIFLFMTADQLAEPRLESIHVVKTSPYTYQSMSGHYVQEVTCSDGNSYFLADFVGIKNLKYHPKLVLKESRYLHHPIAVSQSYRKVVKHAQIHFTLYWAYPLVSFLLFMPCIVLLYRKNNAGFVFLHYTSLIVTSPLLLYILLTGDHILHIFTLGTL
jgi:hypothetical protein